VDSWEGLLGCLLATALVRNLAHSSVRVLVGLLGWGLEEPL